MRRLLLLRHAKAERSRPGERDHDRRLAERGRDDAPKIGAYLSRHRLRAGSGHRVDRRRGRARPGSLAAAAMPRQAAGRFRRAHLRSPRRRRCSRSSRKPVPKVRTLLMVGHNPGLHELAVRLVATGDIETRQRLQEGFPDLGAGGDRVRARRLGPRASAGRPAGTFHHAALDRRGDRLIVTRAAAPPAAGVGTIDQRPVAVENRADLPRRTAASRRRSPQIRRRPGSAPCDPSTPTSATAIASMTSRTQPVEPPVHAGLEPRAAAGGGEAPVQFADEGGVFGVLALPAPSGRGTRSRKSAAWGFARAQISVRKRCVCSVAGRNDIRTRRT